MESALLSNHVKSGIVITNSSGIADIIFRYQMPYGLDYVVILSLVDSGNTISAVPSATNRTLTGFTISTRETKLTGGTYNVAPNIEVYWLVVPKENE